MSMVTNIETAVDRSAAISHGEARKKPYASIEIAEDLQSIRREWRDLQQQTVTSPYQSFEFVSNWLETLGLDQKLEPLIIVARDAGRRPLAILPLAIAQRGPLRFGVFVGGRDSNFNLGLFRSPSEFHQSDIVALLTEAAQSAPRGLDIYYLLNQPREFASEINPLALSISRPSPSAAYATALPKTLQAFDSRLSKDSRKKLKRKEARLTELGELRYEHRAKGELAREILTRLIEQKSKQFGPRFESSAFRAFLERMSSARGESALEVHALTLSNRIIATYAGFAHQNRFSAMLNSYDMSEEIARCSPGDLLLHALIRDLISRGKDSFDLGIGEARYKNSICDHRINLYDTVLPVTMLGALAAPAILASLRLKKKIKQTPWMMRGASRIISRI